MTEERTFFAHHMLPHAAQPEIEDAEASAVGRFNKCLAAMVILAVAIEALANAAGARRGGSMLVHILLHPHHWPRSMKTFSTLACITGIVLLTGCAAAPTPKKVMTGEDYRNFSRMRIGIEKCSESGRIDIATTARSLTVIDSTIERYDYEPGVLRQYYVRHSSETPNDSDCRSLAVIVEQNRQRTEAQNQANAAAAQTNQSFINPIPRSTQTYCNRIGTQTLCSTY